MHSRTVLLVCRAAPDARGRARDALDAALAFGAFEQPVALLLLGDAVLMLHATGAAPAGSLARLAGTLPDYGIGRVHVERDALARRGLGVERLAVPVEPLDDAGIARLIAAHELVLTL